MFVRCPHCLSASWIEVSTPDGLAKSPNCGDCARDLVVAPASDLGPKLSDHYRGMLRLAHKHDLDLPSAYAVLLGVMSLDQAQVLRHARKLDDSGPPGSDPNAETDAPAIELVEDLDPGYRDAIAKGTLTLQDALTRGDRTTYAAGLMRRHELTEGLALRVADNRISLRGALRLREQARESREERRAQPRSNPIRTISMLVLTLLTLTTVALQTLDRESGTQGRTPVVASEPRIERVIEATSTAEEGRAGNLRTATLVRDDDAGRVLEIVGPDPKTVLLSYCDAARASVSLEPLEVTSTVPPFHRARLGLFLDYSAPNSIYAIRIRQDGSGGRWIAGDGLRPIVPREAPDLPLNALRIPVSDSRR